MAYRRHSRRSRANGVVLFVALALLLAITVATLSAAQTAMLQLHMVRNTFDATVAFHAAEAALAEAEAWLAVGVGNPSATFTPDGGAGLYAGVSYREEDPWRQADVWNREARVVEHAVPGTARRARYIVEWLLTMQDAGTEEDPLPPITIDVFRITARATGATDSATVTLQSTFGRIRGGDEHMHREMTGRLSWTDLGP